MFVRAYAVSGVVVIALFVYATSIGWKVIDPGGTTANKPRGQALYHK